MTKKIVGLVILICVSVFSSFFLVHFGKAPVGLIKSIIIGMFFVGCFESRNMCFVYDGIRNYDIDAFEHDITKNTQFMGEAQNLLENYISPYKCAVSFKTLIHYTSCVISLLVLFYISCERIIMTKDFIILVIAIIAGLECSYMGGLDIEEPAKNHVVRIDVDLQIKKLMMSGKGKEEAVINVLEDWKDLFIQAGKYESKGIWVNPVVLGITGIELLLAFLINWKDNIYIFGIAYTVSNFVFLIISFI